MRAHCAGLGSWQATTECFLVGSRDCIIHGHLLSSTGAQACWWCRVSAKLFQCSPAKLPADIKHNMVRLLGCGSRSEGYIRPGCVHFTITSTTSHAQARSIKVRPLSGRLSVAGAHRPVQQQPSARSAAAHDHPPARRQLVPCDCLLAHRAEQVKSPLEGQWCPSSICCAGSGSAPHHGVSPGHQPRSVGSGGHTGGYQLCLQAAVCTETPHTPPLLPHQVARC